MRGVAGSCMKACSQANSPSESLASFFTADDLNTESSRGHFVSGRSGGGNMFLSLLRSSLASGLEKEDATVAMLFSDSLGTGSPLERSLISRFTHRGRTLFALCSDEAQNVGKGTLSRSV